MNDMDFSVGMDMETLEVLVYAMGLVLTPHME